MKNLLLQITLVLFSPGFCYNSRAQAPCGDESSSPLERPQQASCLFG